MRSVLGLFCMAAIASAMDLTVATSYPSPGAVGNPVTWIATVSETAPGTIWYRFRVRAPYGDYKMVRDFSPNPTLDFAALDHEGIYEAEITARHLDTGEIVTGVGAFEFLSRVTYEPLVNATAHPLIFLFSTPPCQEGASMVVEFRTGNAAATVTSAKPCDGALTMNFLLAGLRESTEYKAHYIVFNSSGQLRGNDLIFTTDAVPDAQPAPRVVSSSATPSVSPFLLTSDGVATDLEGHQVWFSFTPLSNITRTEAGGYLWGYVEDPAVDVSYQLLRKMNLLGLTELETNAARVNEQLAALGKRPITSFHHEVRPMSGGRFLALAAVEEERSDVQGSGSVNILGDMILVFDENLNVLWAWDAFEHLDVSRKAILDEKCTPTAGGCPPFYKTSTANDWTHSNAVQFTPDGNLLLSMRHQDWLIKIDFSDGHGDGHIIWKLGKDGDFRLNGADVTAWFSHQHEGNIELADPTRLAVFDNGNTRVAQFGPGNSRGQVWKLDESAMTATPALNADLGVYAVAVGSAQPLPNGNYHFHAGYVFAGPVPSAHTFELNRAGRPIYSLQTDRLLYRTFRLPDLYSPD